jgi:hypothetical protein
MKVLALLPFVLSVALAAPAGEGQIVVSDILEYSDLTGGLFGQIVKGVEDIVHAAGEVEEKMVEQWFEDGKEFVKENGLVCESVKWVPSMAA